eukprot:TRINITY_DN50620_c0_g1_i1.p1 TRINITY_DN50620_c0_g1~~TRINITY_DN50620_c0_g1_i1.p1  ORF type:complete len:569 (+),score=144.31 TRINITY_DN50620_c0_g1_i1:80-1708(+)
MAVAQSEPTAADAATAAGWPRELLWVSVVSTSMKQFLRRQWPPPAPGAEPWEARVPELAGTVNVLMAVANGLSQQVDTELDCAVSPGGRAVTWRSYPDSNLRLALAHAACPEAGGDCAESALATSLLHLVWAAVALIVGCETDCAPASDSQLIASVQGSLPQYVDGLLRGHPGMAPASLLTRAPQVLVVTPKHRAALTQMLEEACGAVPSSTVGAPAALGAMMLVGGRVAAATETWACPSSEQVSAAERQMLLWAVPLLVTGNPPNMASDLPISFMGQQARLTSIRLAGSCIVCLLCDASLAPPLAVIARRVAAVVGAECHAPAMRPLLDPGGPAQQGLGWSRGMKDGKLDAVPLPRTARGVLLCPVPAPEALQRARPQAAPDWWVGEGDEMRRRGQVLLLPHSAGPAAPPAHASPVAEPAALSLARGLWGALETLAVPLPHIGTDPKAAVAVHCTEGYYLGDAGAVAWRVLPTPAFPEDHRVLLVVATGEGVPPHASLDVLSQAQQLLSYPKGGDRDARRVPEAVEAALDADALLPELAAG